MSVPAAIARLLRLYRPSRRGLVFAILVSALQAVMLVPVGLLVADAFDNRIPDGDQRGLLLDGVALVVLYLLSSALGLVVRRWVATTIATGSARVRNTLTRRLHELPLSWHQSRPAGQVHAATVPELDRVEAMAHGAFGLGPALAVVLPLVVFAIVISPLLTAVALVVVPIFMLIARLAARAVRAKTRVWQDAWVAMSRHLHTTLRTMTLIRTRSADDAEAVRAAELAQRLATATRDRAWAMAVSSTLQTSVSSITGVAVLVVGGTLVSRGELGLGELLAFYAVLALALRQAKALGAAANLVTGTESLARLLTILDDQTPPPYSGRDAVDFDGSVALRGVTFGFGDHPILREVNLDVNSGEHVVLVGPNGAGKSTVVALLLGLHRPWAGTVLASGTPLDAVDVTRLRRAIGVVPQLLELRPGTIAENVAFGSQADADAIGRALDLAGLSSWVGALPEGSATVIGEGGVQLSGGESQRVALARALVNRPRLLVLDEPTNHLDAGAVDVLLTTLSTLRPPPAILTITHDAQIARRADRRLTLVEGQIVQAAAHELQVCS